MHGVCIGMTVSHARSDLRHTLAHRIDFSSDVVALHETLGKGGAARVRVAGELREAGDESGKRAQVLRSSCNGFSFACKMFHAEVRTRASCCRAMMSCMRRSCRVINDAPPSAIFACWHRSR
jgi:hypothetical protein